MKKKKTKYQKIKWKTLGWIKSIKGCWISYRKKIFKWDC